MVDISKLKERNIVNGLRMDMKKRKRELWVRSNANLISIASHHISKIYLINICGISKSIFVAGDGTSPTQAPTAAPTGGPNPTAGPTNAPPTTGNLSIA